MIGRPEESAELSLKHVSGTWHKSFDANPTFMNTVLTLLKHRAQSNTEALSCILWPRRYDLWVVGITTLDAFRSLLYSNPSKPLSIDVTVTWLCNVYLRNISLSHNTKRPVAEIWLWVPWKWLAALAGIAGTNSAVGMDVCLLCVFALTIADHSFRGVLPRMIVSLRDNKEQ
jgi:hypothetical protein